MTETNRMLMLKQQLIREALIRTEMWKMMLNTIETPDQYRRMIIRVFGDGKTNQGRWLFWIFSSKTWASDGQTEH